MYIIASIIWIFIAWRWSDWRNWRVYLPTILFYIAGDLFYNVLTYEHTLWKYESFIFPNHTLTNLYVMFTIFPATILLFLSNYPKGLKKQFLWILFWIFLYGILEWIFHEMDLFLYENEWNIWWSIAFLCVMFPMLALHHKRPILTYLLSSIVIIFIVIYFDIPIIEMK